MKLIKPTLQYEKSFREALKEFENEGIGGFWNVGGKAIDNTKEAINRALNHEKGVDLPANWVPATTYWLMDGDRFIGHVNIRHRLTDKLKKIGGHIGYAIRASERGKSYGTKILKLTLPKAREIGIKEALITCDDDNIPSIKIIENNRGILQDTIEVEGKMVRRYHINLH